MVNESCVFTLLQHHHANESPELFWGECVCIDVYIYIYMCVCVCCCWGCLHGSCRSRSPEICLQRIGAASPSASMLSVNMHDKGQKEACRLCSSSQCFSSLDSCLLGHFLTGGGNELGVCEICVVRACAHVRHTNYIHAFPQNTW